MTKAVLEAQAADAQDRADAAKDVKEDAQREAAAEKKAAAEARAKLVRQLEVERLQKLDSIVYHTDPDDFSTVAAPTGYFGGFGDLFWKLVLRLMVIVRWFWGVEKATCAKHTYRKILDEEETEPEDHRPEALQHAEMKKSSVMTRWDYRVSFLDEAGFEIDSESTTLYVSLELLAQAYRPENTAERSNIAAMQRNVARIAVVNVDRTELKPVVADTSQMVVALRMRDLSRSQFYLGRQGFSTGAAVAVQPRRS